MTGFLRTTAVAAACLLGVVAGSLPAAAADYPNRPVRWLIGFAPGGPVDIVARIMAQWLSEHFGQQFVVEEPRRLWRQYRNRRRDQLNP